MKEKYLVINAGSSSLKFSLYEMPDSKEIVNGIVEKIGSNDSSYTIKYNGERKSESKVISNHSEAVYTMIDILLNNKFINDVSEIIGIGHRVLHGGEKYSHSVLITDEVLKDIEDLTKLGPLHHPGNLAGIKAMLKTLPHAINVAVFDTAFHQTMPKENFIYPVPYSWYEENGVRKYGFHGTSHKYITEEMKKRLNKENVNLIICHIGSGASVTCVKNGESYDTSMGLTPLAGVMMGTRSGDIDPSIIEYIAKERNMTIDEVINYLNKESGLKGICGVNDFRDVDILVKLEDEGAQLAVTLFEKSIVKYIGQYYFELNGDVDAIIFTAGIGENMSSFRQHIIDYIAKPMGIKINRELNNEIAKFKKYQEGVISTEDSSIAIYVIPTNEEYMILKDTYEVSGIKLR